MTTMKINFSKTRLKSFIYFPEIRIPSFWLKAIKLNVSTVTFKDGKDFMNFINQMDKHRAKRCMKGSSTLIWAIKK